MKPLVYYLRASKRFLSMWWKRRNRSPVSLERLLKKKWIVKDSTTIPQYRNKFLVNRLGKAFLRREYPKWIHWDHATPETFYINVDMLFPMLADEKSSFTNFHNAWVREQVARRLLDDIVKDKLQPESVELYFAPDGQYGWYRDLLEKKHADILYNKVKPNLEGKFK